ncbi:MAG TPA: hypothetical protein VFH89_12320 [Sphingomicrobium sp.]|nr:hypothetical protein [Sphingomicrobium sp.]
MDQIEKQVRLPISTRPLTEYARYYTSERNGRGFAIYTTFREPKFDTLNLEMGKRRWVSDPGRMPSISDGGCGVIEIEFNSSTGMVERTECNGKA